MTNATDKKSDTSILSMQSHLGRANCSCQNIEKECHLIAVTGGPGAGKTAILNIAQNLLCAHIAFVPEAATIIFSGGFWRLPSANGLKAAQSSIYHVQYQLEAMLRGEAIADVGICDRGTIDGAAYWPSGMHEYWKAMGTSRETELSRYQAVIHLRSPNVEQGFNQSNPQRIESAEKAMHIDQAIFEAWKGHPNRTVINSSTDFRTKIDLALEAIFKNIAEVRKI